MREMKDSNIPFCKQIPSVWSEIPNRYLFFNHSVKVGHDFLSFQLLSLTTSGVKLKDINEKSGKLPDSYENYQTVEPGDMIFCLFDLDCSAVFSGLSSYAGMITSAYDVYRVNPSYALERFIDYWFQFVFSQRHYKMFSKTIRYTVTSDTFKSIYTPIPPLKEQKKIADFLDDKTTSISTLIANNEAQIEALKRYKQSLITETVTRGLDPDAPMKDSGVDWIGQIPESWSVQRVRDIGWTQNGISKKGDFFGSGFPFVSYGDVYRNYELPFSVSGQIESDAKERESYSVQAGDIFFTRTSETIDEVGFSCVCKKTIPEAVFAGFLIRLRPYKAESVILSDYAKYYFRSGHIRQYLTKEMNLVTRASLAQGLLKAMNVLIPPKKEQEAIAAFLDNKTAKIDALISLKQSKIEKLTQYRQSLIYEYVTGKKEAP